MALSADGTTLYVALNGVNKLGVINTDDQRGQPSSSRSATRRGRSSLSGSTAYVSNEGGRPARPGDYTNQSDGTAIVSNQTTGAASTGTVSAGGPAPAQGDARDHGRAAAHGRVPRPPTASCSSPTPTTTRSPSSTPRPARVTPDRQRQPAAGIDGRQLPQRHHHAERDARSSSASAGTTRWPSTATPGPARRCSTSASSRPTSTPWARSTTRRSARSSSPTTRASAPAARQHHQRRAAARRRHPTSVTGHNTYDDTGTITTLRPAEHVGRWPTHTHQVFVDNGWEQLLAATPLARLHGHPGRHPGPARRPVDDQARLPDRQGEPHLRPGARRHRQGQQRPHAGPVRRQRSRPTSTRSPPPSGCSTTSTTRARCRRTATTG